MTIHLPFPSRLDLARCAAGISVVDNLQDDS